jgi:RNAse (barnase) inhibitor barstar
MSGDVTPYTALITSEHSDKPKFMATVTAVVQPFADQIALLQSMSTKFDLDEARGDQLDAVGDWIGQPREVEEPIAGVYFAFDDASVGFDAGAWFGPFDPTAGLISLPDEPYRRLLRFRVQANTWDGTALDADRAYKQFFRHFPPGTFNVLVQDRQDMTIDIAIQGGAPDALTLALIKANVLKPAEVGVGAFLTESVAETSFFGFDAQNNTVAGFDTGAIALIDRT